ncbi:metallophosphoesterase [Patescibacteria group bacterium]|nr:metallophosphoesterase [Patescibacteria group bacterium]
MLKLRRFFIVFVLGIMFTAVIMAVTSKPTTTVITTENPQLANKIPVLTIALVADTHNYNDNLQMALEIAKENKVDFVIHLGDMSNVGTLEELTNAKKGLDESGLEYFVLPGDHEYYVSEWNGSPSINNFANVFGEVLDGLVLTWNSINLKFEIISLCETSSECGNLKSITGFASFVNEVNFKFKNEDKYLFLHEPLYPLGKDSQLLERVRKSNVKAVFAGDAHFSSETPDSVRSSLKHIVIGALTEERNLQTPRFSLLRLYANGEYSVEEIILDNN